MNTFNRVALVLAGSAMMMGGLGCATACRKGPKDDVVVAARTAGEATETGAKTAVEGVKTAGKAAGGLVEGGSSEAKEEWNEGKQKTKATAREGAAETKGEATVPRCPD